MKGKRGGKGKVEVEMDEVEQEKQVDEIGLSASGGRIL